MTTITDLIDVDDLKPSAQQLVANVAAAVTPGAIASTLGDGTLADVKVIAKALGLTFRSNVKLVDLVPEVAEELATQLGAEAPKVLTPEDIQREEEEKAAARRAAAKAPKVEDPQAVARKARYAAADAARLAAMGEAKVEDREIDTWIMTQLRMDPGAVCAREMDVYRWVEGRKVGHQRWNTRWAICNRMIAEGLEWPPPVIIEAPEVEDDDVTDAEQGAEAEQGDPQGWDDVTGDDGDAEPGDELAS